MRRPAFCVSLNLQAAVDRRKVIKPMVYHHPVYNPESLAARRRRKEINGVNHTYFAGAYWGYGFHEDGVNSALESAGTSGKGYEMPIVPKCLKFEKAHGIGSPFKGLNHQPVNQ